MQRHVVVLLACAVACARNGFNAQEGSPCSATRDCHSGAVCASNACRTVCSSDSDCGASVTCESGLCTGGAASPPQVTSVDGTGTTDGGTSHTAHRFRDRLVVNGSHLLGATFSLKTGNGPSTPLVPCGAMTDAQVELSFPSAISAGSYVLTAVNQAGTCSSNLGLLQGESGALIDTSTTCDAGHAGILRFNSTALSLDFCDGNLWQRITSNATADSGTTVAIGPPLSANVYTFTSVTGNYTPAFGAFTNTNDGVWLGTDLNTYQNGACVQAPTSGAQRVVYDLGGVLSIGNIYITAGEFASGAFAPVVAFSMDDATYASAVNIPNTGNSADFSVVSVNPTVSARYVRVTNAFGTSGAPTNASLCDVAVGPPVGTQGAPGYFVLSAGTFDGAMGGLTGADALCQNDLTANTWLNKPANLVPAKIKAWLCDDLGACTNPQAGVTYVFAASGSASAGGAQFYTDTTGTGPNDNIPFSNADRFNATVSYWSGNRQGDDKSFNVGTFGGCSCSSWSSNASGESCGSNTGVSSVADHSRWNAGFVDCSQKVHLICMVSP